MAAERCYFVCGACLGDTHDDCAGIAEPGGCGCRCRSPGEATSAAEQAQPNPLT
jgi:hypothetical protein